MKTNVAPRAYFPTDPRELELWVRSELDRVGWPIARIQCELKFTPNAITRLFGRGHAELEALVASLLGVAPQAIWPTRYPGPGQKRVADPYNISLATRPPRKGAPPISFDVPTDFDERNTWLTGQLHARGWTWGEVARSLRVKTPAVTQVRHRTSRAYQRVIAQLLGMEACRIWPERYFKY